MKDISTTRLPCYCPVTPLSLPDAYRDVGDRATQEAKAERVGESEARDRG